MSRAVCRTSGASHPTRGLRVGGPSGIRRSRAYGDLVIGELGNWGIELGIDLLEWHAISQFPDYPINQLPNLDQAKPLVPVRQQALDGIRGGFDRLEPLPRFSLRQVEHVAIL